MAEIPDLENRHDVIFYAEGGLIWIKFRRLVQNDMSTVVILSKSKPFMYNYNMADVLANSMTLFQSHLPHCRVLPPGEFNDMIPELCVTLQGAAVYNNSSAILKIVFRHVLFFVFFNAVWALTSGGFRIVSDSLVISYFGFRFNNAYKIYSILFSLV